MPYYRYHDNIISYYSLNAPEGDVEDVYEHEFPDASGFYDEHGNCLYTVADGKIVKKIGEALKEITDRVARNSLEKVRRQILTRAIHYSKMRHVDGINIDGKNYHIDGKLRAKLRSRINNEKRLNNTSATLMLGNITMTNTIENFDKLLFQVEVNADKNFDNLQKHIKKIMDFDLEEDLTTYNYTAGYVEQPLEVKETIGE